MENQDTAWHRRKEFIVPILIGLVAAFVPVVIPMNWIAILICWLFLAGCIIWLIFVLVSQKWVRIIISVIVAILLIIGGIYRARDQCTKDNAALIKKDVSHPIAEHPKQPARKEEAQQIERVEKSAPLEKAEKAARRDKEKREDTEKTIGPPPVQKEPQPTLNVALRFVYPKSPALVVFDLSNSVVRDIKWMVVLWNMDLPERNDPLPIPVETFDWLKGHDEGGPQNLFGRPAVASLLKDGNRLFGSASVDCPTCKGKTYVVYIVWGEGGWFAEVEAEKIGIRSGNVLIPNNMLKDGRENYFEVLQSVVPENSKLPIGNR